ncbi:galactose mutarotase-like [Leptopilina heterotoma]|uniref:galactose mutarotase-like n=1 Tax=Leptopilina heterotoma TaxID=63436 RepID=UPI001CA7FB41|nr:galactose mutarotase-like [Leptopilina heterotoma]
MAQDTRIQVDGFGFLPAKFCEIENTRKIVQRYTLTNKNNASVQLISWGAGIQSIRVPNKNNILGDVVLGYDSLQDYLENRYIGRIIDKVDNRFSDGIFRNDKNNYNQTDPEFDSANWESHVLGNQVIMSFQYSGHMLIQVKYSWTNENELHINIRARSTKSTPANFTNYSFFNLAGHATGPKELNNHIVTINADKRKTVNIENNLPSETILPVDSTAYDFRRPVQLNRKKLYSIPGGGFNNNLCISTPSFLSYRFHARILHPNSGRFLEVYSNQPDLHFDTGNNFPLEKRIYSSNLENCPKGKNQGAKLENQKYEMRCKNGALYRRHGAFALIPQNYSNPVNKKNFSQYILQPGNVYSHDMTYKFGVLE